MSVVWHTGPREIRLVQLNSEGVVCFKACQCITKTQKIVDSTMKRTILAKCSAEQLCHTYMT